MLVKIERTNKKNFDTLKMCFDVTNLEQTLARPLPSHRAGPSPDKSGHSVSVNIFPSTEIYNIVFSVYSFQFSTSLSFVLIKSVRCSVPILSSFLTPGTYKECYYTLVLV